MNRVAFWMVAALLFVVGLVWLVPRSYGAEMPDKAPTVYEWTELVTKEGLTHEGCKGFFPQFSGMNLCLVRWNAQKSAERKLELLKNEGDPTALRVFQTSRNHEYRQLIGVIAKQASLPNEAIREMKESTYGLPALNSCLFLGSLHEDQCVLMTGVLVPFTSEELEEFRDSAEKPSLPDSGCSDIACRAAIHPTHRPRTHINLNPKPISREMMRRLELDDGDDDIPAE